MSVTTTTNRSYYGSVQVLRDYDLHHTGSDDSHVDPSPNPREFPDSAAHNPAWWPRDYRPVPAYRPIDRTLDREERPPGQGMFEFFFINIMLRGVDVNARVATLWRMTGGKWNDQIFRYDIGGEW